MDNNLIKNNIINSLSFDNKIKDKNLIKDSIYNSIDFLKYIEDKIKENTEENDIINYFKEVWDNNTIFSLPINYKFNKLENYAEPIIIKKDIDKNNRIIKTTYPFNIYKYYLYDLNIFFRKININYFDLLYTAGVPGAHEEGILPSIKAEIYTGYINSKEKNHNLLILKFSGNLLDANKNNITCLGKTTRINQYKDSFFIFTNHKIYLITYNYHSVFEEYSPIQFYKDLNFNEILKEKSLLTIDTEDIKNNKDMFFYFINNTILFYKEFYFNIPNFGEFPNYKNESIIKRDKDIIKNQTNKINNFVCSLFLKYFGDYEKILKNKFPIIKIDITQYV